MRFRKPRSDSKLKNLAPEKAEQIVEWLTSGMSYARVLQLLEKEPFYIETTDRALSEFYQDFCLPVMVQRQQRAADLANEFYTEASKKPGKFGEATIEELSRTCFELARGGVPNLKGVKSVMGLLLKHQAQQDRAKALEFNREKFRAGLMKKIDLGMEELFEQIKNNAAALDAFNRMKEAIAAK